MMYGHIVLVLLLTLPLSMAGVLSQEVGSTLSVEFDDDLFMSTVPPVMEVGGRYVVRMRITNNSTETGEFYLVVWSETSAIHPRISNKLFLLRPGEAAKTNLTLVGVKPTDQPNVVRAIVYGSSMTGLPPRKMLEIDGEVLRIDPSSALPAITFLLLAVIVAVLLASLLLRRSWARRSSSPL